MNNQLSRQFKISNEAVPKVMGQSGATIKRIQEESGARLIFQGQNNTIYENGRILIIKALDADKLEVARQMVEEFCGPSNIHLVEEEPVFLDLQSFTNQASSPSPSLNSEALGGSVCSQILVEDQFQIPSGIVAFVVGRDQGNLKQLQTKFSLNKIQLQNPCIALSGEKFCAITLWGPFERVEEAKKMLQNMVEKVKQRIPHLLLAPMPSVQTPPPVEEVSVEEVLKPQPVVEKALKPEISAKQPEVQPIVKVLSTQTQIHKKQLKVLEEQQIYFKKRTLLVEKQIQQLDMDNYVKRSQLQLPASLTIEYNGHTYELSNQIDPQATDKEDLRKLEKEKKMP
uniref:K Homology domain-containing protein n=1 Tax=Ditylenchus dipsaci TaxID=166011 RepID=A0A915CX76_9BILA